MARREERAHYRCAYSSLTRHTHEPTYGASKLALITQSSTRPPPHRAAEPQSTQSRVFTWHCSGDCPQAEAALPQVRSHPKDRHSPNLVSARASPLSFGPHLSVQPNLLRVPATLLDLGGPAPQTPRQRGGVGSATSGTTDRPRTPRLSLPPRRQHIRRRGRWIGARLHIACPLFGVLWRAPKALRPRCVALALGCSSNQNSPSKTRATFANVDSGNELLASVAFSSSGSTHLALEDSH